MREHIEAGWMSDIDGTAVRLADKKFSLQNARKSPLAPIEGFTDFYQGVASVGLLFLGFVTRRPDIAQRRRATNRSLTQLNLPRKFTITHAGTLTPTANHEGRKARVVADAAVGRRVLGFIDDKPHRIGAELLLAIQEIEADPTKTNVSIVLGAVNQEGSAYYDQFVDTVRAEAARDSSIGFGIGESGASIYIGQSTLQVITFDEMSVQTGRKFAHLTTRHML